MKKTVNINLGNQVFQIDEDAYQLLANYLEDLKYYFQKEKGHEEIIQDIEYRLSELFDEKTRLGYRVITIEIVEQMIGRIGRPEELRDEDEANEQGATDERKSSSEESNLKEEPAKKRFYRNPDDMILGGVASGIAAYFDCDPIWIRLLFVALLFFKGFVVPVYILLWIIMPKAKTATQKLEMRGKRITVENIGKTVTESFDRIASNFQEPDMKKLDHGIRNFLNGAMQVIGFLLKIILGIFAVVLCFPLLIVAIVLVVLIIALPMGLLFSNEVFFPMRLQTWMHRLLGSDSLILMPGNYYSPAFLVLSLLAFAVTVLIPLGSLIYFIVVAFRPMKPVSRSLKWTLFILWIAALGYTVYSISHIGMQLF